MKNETKKIVIYLPTQSIHGVGDEYWGGVNWGGVNWMKRGENFNLNLHRLSSCLFMPPLFEIEHYLTTGRDSLVGLFIGHFFVSAILI
jgi:hypothetical protein